MSFIRRRGRALRNPDHSAPGLGSRFGSMTPNVRSNLNYLTFAQELVEGFAADVTIADKGYDADRLCDGIAETGGQAVIPPTRNRTFKRPYDAELYKERNIIERFFNKLKQFRRVATRYDKLLANFMGFVKLAAIVIWLK